MSSVDHSSIADARDRHMGIVAFFMLALAVKYAADAGTHFVGADAARYLDMLGTGLALAAVAVILPVAIWKFRKLPRGQRHLYHGTEGFVSDASNRAHVSSWLATFFALVALEVASDSLPNLPAGFFLQAGLAVMLGAFGVSFFILNRDVTSPEGADAEAGEPSRA